MNINNDIEIGSLARDLETFWNLSAHKIRLTASKTMLGDPYISRDETHQGLLLHSIYHLRELALYLHRTLNDQPYHCFFGGLNEK